MWTYFLRRLLLVIPTFIGITMAVFVVMQLVPGGPVERRILQYQMGALATGRTAEALPEDAIQQIREYYGFDKPIHERYLLWLGNIARMNLGNSYVYQEPVWDVIKARFPVSIFLGLSGFLMSYLLCIPLGVMKAVRHGTVRQSGLAGSREKTSMRVVLWSASSMFLASTCRS